MEVSKRYHTIDRATSSMPSTNWIPLDTALKSPTEATRNPLKS